MGKIRQSLSLKLNLGILLLVVAIFVVSIGLLFLQSRRILRQKAIERATVILNGASLRVGQYMNEAETATNNIDWLVLQHLYPDSLLAYSRRVVELNPNINGCSITTEPDIFKQYGRYFSAYSVREGDSITTVREGEYEYFEKVWYKTPSTLGKACWVDPFDDFNAGTLYTTELIVSYCKPLYADSSQLIGVISTDLSLRQLSKTITAEQPYKSSYFFMLGGEGQYFIHPDTTKLFRQTIFSSIYPNTHPDIIALGHEMTKGKQGNMKIIVNDEPCLVCYQPLPDTNWSIAIVCLENDVLRGYHRLVYIVIPLIIVGLLFTLLLIRYAVILAVEPLQQLVSQSQQIAAGNYGQQIARSGRIDAVGRLQNSFATMQESLARHINSIKQVNIETAQRNAELLQASQLAQESTMQKTAFIQNMTHQIRTPLNIIMGFSQILRDSVKQLEESEAESIIELMERNTVTLNRMSAMLYDSSDQGTVALNRNDYVSCNEVARECITDAHRQFPDGLQINFETELPDSLCIHTDHLYLFRSIREILYNSAKYADSSKPVSVRISETDTTVRFTIEDYGPGIAEEDRDRLFKPFTKTNDLSEGLGLGLPLTMRHIRNLGGNLSLDTTYHGGCRFVIELSKS